MGEEENSHPLPWTQGEMAPWHIFDSDGMLVASCDDEDIAALIVRLVNAKGKGKG